jgi:hypothetical protein
LARSGLRQSNHGWSQFEAARVRSALEAAHRSTRSAATNSTLGDCLQPSPHMRRSLTGSWLECVFMRYLMLSCVVAVTVGAAIATNAGPLRRSSAPPSEKTEGMTVIPRSAPQAPPTASALTNPFTTTPVSILSGRSLKTHGSGASPVALAGGATPPTPGGGNSPMVIPQPVKLNARAE